LTSFICHGILLTKVLHSTMIWRYKKQKKKTDHIGLTERICSVSISLLMLLFIVGAATKGNFNERKKTSTIR